VGKSEMSTNFTLDFLGDHIRIQHPDDYEITPESQLQLWHELGEACNKYGCWRVLALSQLPPKRNMSQADALRSATQAAKASTKLRVAIVLKGYEPDKTTEFFVNSAYKYGVRIEFFADPEEARKWLCLDSGRAN
jgi:hypothetical protein